MARVFAEGRLVYGMQLPIQSQSTIYAEPWEASATALDLAEVARAADRAGFGYLATCDHVAIPRRLAGAMSTVWYDPVATLAFLAGITERVRLLSHVAILGLRHPCSAPSSTPPSTTSRAAGSSSASARATCRRSSRPSASTSPGAGPSSTRPWTRCAPPSGPRSTRSSRASGSPSRTSASCRAPPSPASPSGSGLLARRRAPGRGAR